MKSKKSSTQPTVLEKSPTGIAGFDDITGGGLPKGRPTLVCGSAGSGKSLFAAEFLIRGATEYDEPGVLMTFEETARDIEKNVSALGFDIHRLVARKKIVVDQVQIERSEIEENGEYDLEGLFIRLDHAINSIGAKRVVLDTIEALFTGLNNQTVLRAEIRRLFRWLKDRGLTTVITGERGDSSLTRQGLEEYVSDCVILLDHRVTGQISTRRLRVIKYRGSTHGTNEYPFLIDQDGISVLPLTSSGMDYDVSNERVSSGIPELDDMLGGRGFYRGSSILLSGTAGTGKTSVAAQLADSTCRRGERCLFFSFEESPAQIVRNMRSIGIKLEPHIRSGLLRFHSSRPTMHGLEMHLVRLHHLIQKFDPAVVILDPVSNLQSAGSAEDSMNMLIRLIDVMRKKQITGLFASLVPAGVRESADDGMSSLVDTWVLVRDLELNGERNRTLYVRKARGLAHSNQVREFQISSKGIRLVPAYIGPAGVTTGSARLAQEAREKAESRRAADEIRRQELVLQNRRKAIDAQIEALRAAFKAEEQELEWVVNNDKNRSQLIAADRLAMARNRQALAPK